MIFKNQLSGIAQMARMQESAKETLTKNLGEYFSSLEKQNGDILDAVNDLIKAEASIYQLLKAVAEKQGVKIPKPYTDMEIERKE